MKTEKLRVIRKRDGATGKIIRMHEAYTPGVRFPFKTLVDIRLDDATLRANAGGDITGDLSWLRSNFKRVS